MKKNKRQKSVQIKNQAGAALLIGMVVLAAVAAFYMMGQFGAVSSKHDRQDKRVVSLAAAKKALIAHAVNYIDMASVGGVPNDGEMGFLPCPDTSAANPGFEGVSAGNCEGQNINAIGRFPWKTLKMPPQYDDSNECLWYAVSGYYKANPKTQMLNEDTNGMFDIYNAADNRIYGENPEDRIVAVIIAPGTPVQNQSRANDDNAVRCKGQYSQADYLEGIAGKNNAALNAAADQIDALIKAGTNSPFNDLIVTISRDEIWNAVKRRKNYLPTMQGLTQSIAQCLVAYGNANAAIPLARNLPWPASIDLDGNNYRDDTSYQDVNAPASLLGRLPDSVDNSETALAAATFPPGPPAGVPPGPPNNVPPGGGNGNGNNGNGNGNGNGNNNNNGGGGNVVVLTNPPTGDPECVSDCWNEYLDEIAEAKAEYQECLVDGEPPGQCKNERNDEFQEALDDYNACLTKYTCTAGPPPGGGGSGEKGITEIITGCLAPADFALWQHWKDHFYYAVSGDYAPDSTSTTCTANCVTVNGVEQAAIVFFAGERQAGISRNDPIIGDTDTKALITNYLEPNNANNYPDANGNGAYDKDAGNDYLYCIEATDPLVVGNNCP